MAVPNALHVRAVRCDGAGEYVSADFQEYASRCGFTIHKTAPHSQQQNGVAERYNRTLFTRVRCVLADAALPLELWNHVALAVNYVINLSPTKALSHTKYVSPLHAWHDTVPDLSHLRVIGAHVFVHIEKASKLMPRSWRGRFLGYAGNSRGYKVWNEGQKQVFESRHVSFMP